MPLNRLKRWRDDVKISDKWRKKRLLNSEAEVGDYGQATSQMANAKGADALTDNDDGQDVSDPTLSESDAEWLPGGELRDVSGSAFDSSEEDSFSTHSTQADNAADVHCEGVSSKPWMAKFGAFAPYKGQIECGDGEESSVSNSDVDDMLLGYGNEELMLANGQLDRSEIERRRAALQRKRNRKRRSRKSRPYSNLHKKKAKRRTAAAPTDLSPEVKTLMQDANNAYLEMDFSRAISLFEEVIRKAPGLHDPFHSLGVIYEKEYNDLPKAAQFYLLAAHLVPGDVTLWKQIGQMSEDLGDVDKAVYCYRRCLRNSSAFSHCDEKSKGIGDGADELEDDVFNVVDSQPVDEEIVFALAICLMQKGDFRRASHQLKLLRSRHPDDPFLTRELARCYHFQHLPTSAIAILEKFCFQPKTMGTDEVERQNVCVDLEMPDEAKGCGVSDLKVLPFGRVDLNCLNMLCDLYIEASQYERCLAVLKKVFHAIPHDKIPLELAVKFALAHIYIYAEDRKAPLPTPSTFEIPGMANDNSANTIDPALNLETDPKLIISETFQPVVLHVYLTLLNKTDRKAFYDLFISLADALYAANQPSCSSQLLLAVMDVKEASSKFSMRMKLARCFVKFRQLKEAVCVLKWCLGMPNENSVDAAVAASLKLPDYDVSDKNAGLNDAEARLLLCNILCQLGRTDEVDTIVLSLPSYKDIRDAKALPKPMPRQQRHDFLNRLTQDTFIVFPEAGVEELTDDSYTSVDFGSSLPCLPLWTRIQPSAKSDMEAKRDWICRFLHLVRECELDAQRILWRVTHRKLGRAQKLSASSKQGSTSPAIQPTAEEFLESGQSPSMSDWVEPQDDCSSVDAVATSGGDSRSLSAPSTKGAGGNNASEVVKISYAKYKEEMGLVPLESLLGWTTYGTFLITGMCALAQLNLFTEASTLLGNVLANRRLDKSIVNEAEKKKFKKRIKIFNFALGLEGHLIRSTISFLRERFLKRPDSVDGNRALETYCQMMFTGELSRHCLSSIWASAERDMLTENRAWSVRQLLQRPMSFPLTLIVAHFCCLSGRWSFAVAEYTRAHRLMPRDELTCLCLATAYLSLSTSRIVNDRHSAVLRGMAILSKYASLRKDGAMALINTCGKKTSVDSAASHHAALFLNAEVTYNFGRAYHLVGLSYLAAPLYLRCLRLLKAAQKKVAGKTFCDALTFTRDCRQLMTCAAYNLSHVLGTNLEFVYPGEANHGHAARNYLHSYIIWD